ncbi:MAG: FmdB family zinc ribbon protein [Bacteroidota bacterium]|jgi:putative FmdB family regulatory protein|nr:zinc ribbon domain-containing protein [Ignavibacteria bacterium]HEX2960182.1 FmdB family zinc ribbon protein [Ignavibacteriales bacterium]MCU7498939.1 zinc ribbon domain-containing protein [Ignavibacteria bacterium]MCU7513323.1 zinc ribbon domain-containing protein [Ignavibacteria bacterium]MCU7521385.1 zinc ribbon domain-containing protein [Ignavibacteria bacterium]
MPTYDYKCTECGYSFEYFQKMTDSLLEECPQCHGKLKRLIGPGAGPIFKGTGFYQTDYKNKGNGSGSSKSKSVSIPKNISTSSDTK